ncbi:hypothetical protein J2W96_006877 [Variovorax guangxiensis]|nr:hypothetical protein [Variovorax guangxiensis]
MSFTLTRSPDRLTPSIEATCRRLSPTTSPQFVDRSPLPDAVINKCTFNVKRFLEMNPGEMVLGWDVCVWEGALIDCIGHAVVRHDDRYGCVTPSRYPGTRPLFLQDPPLDFDFSEPMARMPSTQIPLSTDRRSAGLSRSNASSERSRSRTRWPRAYWNQPEANASAFTADGYFRTGDVGELDAQGFLKIVDRKKDMVIVSGFNVFPNEIEAVATVCPGVAESACIGVADEKTGEALKLFVVKQPGAEPSVEQIAAYCRRELTSYKVPRHIQFIDALPMSTVGKILRRDLRTL